jgi:uncharacterized OB-fold protein
MEVPRHWRLKKQRYAMVGEICPNCKQPNFPPRAVCPHCSSGTKHEYQYQEQPTVAIAERAPVIGD